MAARGEGSGEVIRITSTITSRIFSEALVLLLLLLLLLLALAIRADQFE
jgi:hypothetical protein